MGESLMSILAIFEGPDMEEARDRKIMYGDNTAALSIIQTPDGPWRTRHLRLRSFL